VIKTSASNKLTERTPSRVIAEWLNAHARLMVFGTLIITLFLLIPLTLLDPPKQASQDPSGRVFEIQENSDTTYRLYDWDRTGLNGKPRELHVEKALQSINFNDTEPALCDSTEQKEHGYSHYLIAKAPGIFHLSHLNIETEDPFTLPGKGVRLLAITDDFMTLQVKGRDQLAILIRKLRKLRNILSVQRIHDQEMREARTLH